MANGGPSIQSLSERLGLSKATVSKALNGYKQVSPVTRARVLDMAAQMGYTASSAPSASAPAPRRIGWPYRAPTENYEATHLIVRGFQDLAPQLNMEIVLLPEFSDAFRAEHRLRDVVAQNKLDGLFLSSLRIEDDYLEQVGDLSLPVLFWDLPIELQKPNFGFIAYDSLEGARMAVSHLTSLGHRRIGFLNGHRHAYVSWQRLDGYRLALSRAGIGFDDHLVYEGDFSIECGGRAFNQLMPQGVTAIFCASDKMAIGVMRAAQAAGVVVPQDLSIVGYDDEILCTAVTPGLTTIGQDFSQIGRVSCSMMDCLLRGLPLAPVSLRPRLVLRESACAAR